MNLDRNEPRLEASDELLAELRKLPRIELLDVRGPVTADGVKNLAHLRRLRSLSINSRTFTDDDLRPLSELVQLQTLSLYFDKITGDGLAHLSGLKRLHALQLYSHQLADEGLAHLKHLGRLRLLTIGSEEVKGPGLAHLSALKELRELRLHCPISDEALSHLHGLTSLEELVCARYPGIGDHLEHPTQFSFRNTPLADCLQFLDIVSDFERRISAFSIFLAARPHMSLVRDHVGCQTDQLQAADR